MCVCVCVCEGVGLHDCGGPQPPLLQYIHREPGAGHAGEWVGCSLGDMCTHMLTCTSMHKVHLSLLSYSPTGLQIVLILSHSLPTPTPQYTYTQFILLYSIPPVCYMHTNYVVYIIFNVGISSSVFLPPPTPTCRGWEGHSCGGVWVSHEVT